MNHFYFQAVGIAAFTLLGWVLTDTSFLLTLAEKGDKYYIGLLVFVGIATLILVIAFLGCCGALRESQCLLVTVSFHIMHVPSQLLWLIYKYNKSLWWCRNSNTWMLIIFFSFFVSFFVSSFASYWLFWLPKSQLEFMLSSMNSNCIKWHVIRLKNPYKRNMASSIAEQISSIHSKQK